MSEKLFHTVDLKKYSFLVTGGAGFIGSHIVDYLLKFSANKVIVLDNLSTGSLKNIEHHFSNPAFQFIQGDICDYNTCLLACKNMDYVLHQAALGSVPHSILFPIKTHQSNVTGFVNMLTAVKESKVRRFIYASSSSVYGDNSDFLKVEHKLGKQLSPYAVSKITDELYASVFADLYQIEIIGLRYFNIYGPRQKSDGPYAAAIPRFTHALLSGTSPLIYGDGNQTRDFTFIENAVQANIKSLFIQNPDAINQVYNIAVGESTSINQLFNIIKENIETQASAIYTKPRIGEIKHSLADITKAKNILKYNPFISIQEGIRITISYELEIRKK